MCQSLQNVQVGHCTEEGEEERCAPLLNTNARWLFRHRPKEETIISFTVLPSQGHPSHQSVLALEITIVLTKVSFKYRVVTLIHTYKSASLVGKRCSVIRKETLFQMSLAWTRSTWRFIGKIYPSSLGLPPQEYVSLPFVLAIGLTNIRFYYPFSPSVSWKSVSAFRLGHNNRRDDRLHPETSIISVLAIRLGDIHLSHQPSGHPSRPSVSRISIWPIYIGLPSRGQPSRQIKIKYFNQPSQGIST